MKIKQRKLESLRLDESNIIRHETADITAIARSLNEFGQQTPIVISSDGWVAKGNGTVLAAQKLGWSEIACHVSKLTEAQLRAYSVADNQTGRLAEWDTENLIARLEQVRGDDLALLQATAFDAEQLADLLDTFEIPDDWTDEIIPKDPADESEEEVPAEIDRAEELREKWGTELGQFWQIGPHRLLCGDCTRGWLNDEKFPLVVSSPPYFNQRAYSQWESYEAYLAFASEVVSSLTRIAAKDSLIVWNIGSDEQARRWMPSDWWCAFRDTDWMYRESIAWVKAGAVFSVPRSMHIENGHYFPALQWEVVLVLSKGNHPTFDLEDRDYVRSFQENVWQFPVVQGLQQAALGHNAPYPVELPRRAITAYSKKGDSVYDPFLGSGTTMLAAHQLGRVCYGIEISPAYCAVILQRMTDAGLECKLIAASDEVQNARS